MIKLIGITEDVYQDCIGESFKTDTSEEIVALFSSEQLANEYVEKSRLKKIRRESFAGDVAFRDNSVLRGCADYRIEEPIELVCPLDPAL